MYILKPSGKNLVSEISRFIMVDCLLVLLNILANQLKDIVLDLHRLVIVEQFRENPEHGKRPDLPQMTSHLKMTTSSQLKAMGIFSSVSLENDGKAKLKNGCWCRHSFEPVGHSLKRLVIMMMLLNHHHHHHDDDATLLNHD